MNSSSFPTEYVHKDFEYPCDHTPTNKCPHCGNTKKYFSCEECSEHPCGEYGCGVSVVNSTYCREHMKRTDCVNY